MRFFRRHRLFWTALAIALGMAASMLAARQIALRAGLHEESRSVQRQLRLYAQALVQRIDRYRTLPEVLALDEQLKAALSRPPDRPLSRADIERLNRKLEQANGASQSSTLTLINLQGKAVAASNWREPHSNVGEDYSFRPYVQQALATGSGRFYGIGMTTGVAGYFLSRAIRADDGSVLGLIAIKIALQELESEWRQAPDVVLASDAHGVVFLASRDDWRYRLLRPLTQAEHGELEATRQYADQRLQPLRWRTEQDTGDGGLLARFAEPRLSGPVLWHSLRLPDTHTAAQSTQPSQSSQWELHLLHNVQSSLAASRWAALAAAGLWLALALSVLFVRQRQRSRREREAMQRQHAQELRIAERTASLETARLEAERANRYKTRFVAAAVHDLLQPLNAARMYCSLLPAHLQDSAGRQAAQGIDQALASQDAILTSLLDIARMESGQLEVHVRDFPLNALLEVVRNNFGMQAENAGLTLRCLPTRAVVRSDEALLRRILQNFVSNAIRYTRRGRIVVGCRRSAGQLRIEVHDQGSGIPASLQKEIFEEFRRLDSGHADDRGTGLGLAIVERLGKLLSHEIGLRSQLGQGSVFWVSVPLGDARAAAPAPPPVDTADSGPLQGGSVWYVEDDAPTRAATQALLQRWGCRMPFSGGAPEALAQAAPGNAPRLVLLDVHLGAHYGPEVYAQLCERWGQSPPVILLTAEGDSTLRRQAAERGWGFLAKPVRPPALRALISQMLLHSHDNH